MSDSVGSTHAWGSYDILDVSEFNQMEINYSKLFADQRTTSTASKTSRTSQSDTRAPIMASPDGTLFIGRE